MKTEASNDVTRIMLLVLVIGALIVGSFWTLLPFLSGLIWGTTIALATWPALVGIQRLVFGRRWVAVLIITVLVSIAFIVPFAVAVSTVLDAANRSPAVIEGFLAHGLGLPPEWIGKIPLIGERIANQWRDLIAGGPDALVQAVQPYARSAAAWAIAATGGFGKMLVLIFLTVVIVAILYAQGEIAAQGILAFAYRLGGESGKQIMILAGKAVRSVALGVVVTALVQTLLAGLGLWVAGVPFPGLLTALIFMFCIAQIGPFLILAGAIVWLYWTDHTGWATVLLIWSLPVGALDNVLRPLLIRRGITLPMLLIIAGVIGGLISFGLVGLFVGPVILAATYTLVKDWVGRSQPEVPAATS